MSDVNKIEIEIKIEVVIVGVAAAGKTRLAHLLATYFAREGATVSICDDGRTRPVDKGLAGVSLPLHVKVATSERAGDVVWSSSNSYKAADRLEVVVSGISRDSRSRLAHRLAMWLEREGATVTVCDGGRKVPVNPGYSCVTLPMQVNITTAYSTSASTEEAR